MTTDNGIERYDHIARGLGWVITQYSESPNLKTYIEVFLKQIQELEDVAHDVITERWLDNAVGAQLDVIGIIVGQPRELVDASLYEYFGFQSNPVSRGFGTGRWRSRGEPITGIRILSDEEYRLFIRARIVRNVIVTTPDEVIEIIKFIFGVDVVNYTEGPYPAHYQIEIGKVLSANEQALIDSGIVPKTAGVSVDYSGL